MYNQGPLLLEYCIVAFPGSKSSTTISNLSREVCQPFSLAVQHYIWKRQLRNVGHVVRHCDYQIMCKTEDVIVPHDATSPILRSAHYARTGGSWMSAKSTFRLSNNYGTHKKKFAARHMDTCKNCQ